MKKLLLLLLLLYPMTAAAETYQWTDERGTVNFAEDLGKVPKKYRKKARKVGEDAMETPAQGGRAAGERQPASPAATPKAEEPKGSKKLYGERDEATWRRDFQQAAANLEAAESELATLKGRLADTSRMSRSEYIAIQNSIRHGETRVQELTRRMNLLKETADRYGVPQSFRQ